MHLYREVAGCKSNIYIYISQQQQRQQQQQHLHLAKHRPFTPLSQFQPDRLLAEPHPCLIPHGARQAGQGPVVRGRTEVAGQRGALLARHAAVGLLGLPGLRGVTGALHLRDERARNVRPSSSGRSIDVFCQRTLLVFCRQV